MAVAVQLKRQWRVQSSAEKQTPYANPPDKGTDRLHATCSRLHVLLRWEGWAVNHKRVHRPYTEEGLSIRTKLPRRKRARRYRHGRPGADERGQTLQ